MLFLRRLGHTKLSIARPRRYTSTLTTAPTDASTGEQSASTLHASGGKFRRLRDIITLDPHRRNDGVLIRAVRTFRRVHPGWPYIHFTRSTPYGLVSVTTMERAEHRNVKAVYFAFEEGELKLKDENHRDVCTWHPGLAWNRTGLRPLINLAIDEGLISRDASWEDKAQYAVLQSAQRRQRSVGLLGMGKRAEADGLTTNPREYIRRQAKLGTPGAEQFDIVTLDPSRQNDGVRYPIGGSTRKSRAEIQRRTDYGIVSFRLSRALTHGAPRQIYFAVANGKLRVMEGNSTLHSWHMSMAWNNTGLRPLVLQAIDEGLVQMEESWNPNVPPSSFLVTTLDPLAKNHGRYKTLPESGTVSVKVATPSGNKWVSSSLTSSSALDASREVYWAVEGLQVKTMTKLGGVVQVRDARRMWSNGQRPFVELAIAEGLIHLPTLLEGVQDLNRRRNTHTEDLGS